MQKPFRPTPSGDPLLVVTLGVPVGRKGNLLFLDDKAVSGLMLYSRYWPGRVRCILRQGMTTEAAFGRWYDPASLPFEVVVAPDTAFYPDGLLEGAAVVLGAADNHLDLSLASQCSRLNVPLVFVIEYIFETRLQIIALSGAPLIERAKRTLWAVKTELKRRRALAGAAAIQANGTPAAESYAKENREILTYFDTRLSNSMVASEDDIAEKMARRAAGGPLRLAFSGRLERMKGADHLLPLINRLIARDIDFRFDVFGAGSLSPQFNEAITQHRIATRLNVHGPVDFAGELVPWMRQHADIFVCCHRQSDPSCTYMETLGCGVPIVAYRNRAIEGITNIADIGWLVEKDNIDALADQIERLANHREQIYAKARTAIALASEHTFESTFFDRVAQLRAVSFGGRQPTQAIASASLRSENRGSFDSVGSPSA